MSKATVRIEVDGHVLEFETEEFAVSTPHDVIKSEDGYTFTGVNHVNLSATFPPGEAPRWREDRA